MKEKNLLFFSFSYFTSSLTASFFFFSKKKSISYSQFPLSLKSSIVKCSLAYMKKKMFLIKRKIDRKRLHLNRSSKSADVRITTKFCKCQRNKFSCEISSKILLNSNFMASFLWENNQKCSLSIVRI